MLNLFFRIIDWLDAWYGLPPTQVGNDDKKGGIVQDNPPFFVVLNKDYLFFILMGNDGLATHAVNDSTMPYKYP